MNREQEDLQEYWSYLTGSTTKQKDNKKNKTSYIDETEYIEERDYQGYGKSYEICVKVLFSFCIINLIISIILLRIYKDLTFLVDALITCLTWGFTIYCLKGIAISHRRIDILEEEIKNLKKRHSNKPTNKEGILKVQFF